MAKRSTAISRYKAAARKIKRDRAKGLPLVTAPASGMNAEGFRMQIVRNGPDSFVACRPNGAIAAGPFDTRQEAQEWIDEQ